MKGLKKVLLALSLTLFLLATGSCGPSQKTVDNNRRGLLMMEGENIHKNKGFYNSKKKKKAHRKNKRMMRKNQRNAKKQYRR